MSKNRVYRLMSQEGLLVTNCRDLKTSQIETKKPKATYPNQCWGTDMTKGMMEAYGWLYVVIVIDWYTKKVVGHYAGEQAKTSHWLEAFEQAVNQQLPEKIRKTSPSLQLISDNGCQPTSTQFMKACSLMGIKQAFTKRFMRTLKEELVWINEWRSPIEFKQRLDEWIDEYNHYYLHSSLGYLPPITFELNSPLNAA